MNNIKLPAIFNRPSQEQSVSILITNYNTNKTYIEECLDSIKHQDGYFNIELVWINDGSSKKNTKILKKLLSNFNKTTRFCKLVYAFFNDNKGPGYCSNKGISMCTNEIIFRMDSDDIMSHNRIETQLQFMKNTPDCVICGSNIQFFHVNNENQKIRGQTTNHPLILTWDQYKIVKSHWFMNHPSICYKNQRYYLLVIMDWKIFLEKI